MSGARSSGSIALPLLLACTGAAPPVAPVITKVSPSTLRANVAASLRIAGSGFSAATTATFDGTAVAASAPSDTILVVGLPAELVLTPHLARLALANGTEGVSADLSVLPEKPTITAFEPAS